MSVFSNLSFLPKMPFLSLSLDAFPCFCPPLIFFWFFVLQLHVVCFRSKRRRRKERLTDCISGGWMRQQRNDVFLLFSVFLSVMLSLASFPISLHVCLINHILCGERKREELSRIEQNMKRVEDDSSVCNKQDKISPPTHLEREWEKAVPVLTAAPSLFSLSSPLIIVLFVVSVRRRFPFLPSSCYLRINNRWSISSALFPFLVPFHFICSLLYVVCDERPSRSVEVLWARHMVLFHSPFDCRWSVEGSDSLLSSLRFLLCFNIPPSENHIHDDYGGGDLSTAFERPPSFILHSLFEEFKRGQLNTWEDPQKTICPPST